jgi:hypothetical protein
MTRFVDSFEEVRTPFETCIGGIVHATRTTVDRRGRPRARVLIPVWEVVDDRPVGWLATHRTPVEAAHLAGNPHATFSCWTPRQDLVAIDTVARWVDDEVTRRHLWEVSGVASRGRPRSTRHSAVMPATSPNIARAHHWAAASRAPRVAREGDPRRVPAGRRLAAANAVPEPLLRRCHSRGCRLVLSGVGGPRPRS